MRRFSRSVAFLGAGTAENCVGQLSAIGCKTSIFEEAKAARAHFKAVRARFPEEGVVAPGIPPSAARWYYRAERRLARASQDEAFEKMRLGMHPYDAAYWDDKYKGGLRWPNRLDFRYQHHTAEELDDMSRKAGFRVPPLAESTWDPETGSWWIGGTKPHKPGFQGHSFGG